MKKQILLIEDDRLVAKSLTHLLDRSGFKVMFANNGELAFKLAQNNYFDLIISDIRMPGELGTEVVKKINISLKTPIPFIFITGYADEVYIREADAMGCVAFFLKPFDNDVLLQKLQKVLSVEIQIEDRPIINGQLPPSRIKRFFYNALGSQWNPEKEIEWNNAIGLEAGLSKAIAIILSPIIMGEYSAFNALPKRIISFGDYEVKQYLAVQLVDETRHAEAFDLYLTRINGHENYKKSLRNIYALRFFNRLKKLNDNNEWITGLYLTEILAHVLLTAYAESAKCELTQHLFKMILSDEGRHISFCNFYLKEILRHASASDAEGMLEIAKNTLDLTKGMLYSFEQPYNAFGLNPKQLFERISKEVDIRFVKNILKPENVSLVFFGH